MELVPLGTLAQARDEVAEVTVVHDAEVTVIAALALGKKFHMLCKYRNANNP